MTERAQYYRDKFIDIQRKYQAAVAAGDNEAAEQAKDEYADEREQFSNDYNDMDAAMRDAMGRGGE